MFGNSTLKFDDDDDFLDPNCNSMLPKIFGISMDASPDQQQQNEPSLKYIPPKQPQSANNAESSSTARPEWQTTMAKVVFAYKLVNQENIPQGKIGLAVLRNADDNCKIILYRTKQNILASVNLTATSVIYIKQQFLQFLDDEQVFWSLIFDGEDRQVFLKEVKGKCAISDEEATKSQTELDASKSSILSRLAKMGKPLPQLVSTTEISDSSDTDEKQMNNYGRQRPANNKLVPIGKTASSTTVTQEPIREHQSTVSTVSTAGRILTTYGPSLIQDSGLNVLLAESRTQNTEIRMNLSKLETKIEKVLDKFDLIDYGRGCAKNAGHSAAPVDREDEILKLEERLLEMKKENRLLRVKVGELSEKFVDSARSKDDEAEIKRLQKELQKVQAKDLEYDQIKIKFDEMQKDVRNTNDRLKEMEGENQRLRSELHTSEESKSKTDLDKTNLEQELEALKISIDDKCDELKRLQASSNSSDAFASLNAIVKEVMNNLYQKLTEEFSTKDSFDQSEILRKAGSIIKTETLAVLSRTGP